MVGGLYFGPTIQLERHNAAQTVKRRAETRRKARIAWLFHWSGLSGAIPERWGLYIDIHLLADKKMCSLNRVKAVQNLQDPGISTLSDESPVSDLLGTM